MAAEHLRKIFGSPGTQAGQDKAAVDAQAALAKARRRGASQATLDAARAEYDAVKGKPSAGDNGHGSAIL